MERKKYFIPMIIIIVVLEISSVIFIWNFNTDKATKLDEVSLKSENKVPAGLAIMLENDTNDGKYAESTSSLWPSSTDYRFNKELSGCIDDSGNAVENALTYDKSTNSVKIKTRNNISCYMYFDLKLYLSELCSSGDILGSCITDNNEEIDSLDNTAYSGMYRYTGTNEIVDDNYICFGTTDKDTCVNNPETYMYRVIGVTSEANSTLGLDVNQLKLIKHTSIGTHQWHSDYTFDAVWEDSTIYDKLQNEIYLNNKTYLPTGWVNKISSVKWNVGDVQINTYTNATTIIDMEVNLYTTKPSKIGLMYLSDYFYAYNKGGTRDCYNNLCVNWMTLENIEWTMTRFGLLSNLYHTWLIEADSTITAYPTSNNVLNIRPVFYLNSDEQYISGDGTIDNPIMLSEPPQPQLFGEYLIENPSTGLNTTTAYSGMYRYIGTTANNYVKLGDVLYRVIGITSEANSTLGLAANQVKLLKAESIGTLTWHTSTYENATWNTSGIDAAMYKYLNDLDSDTTNQVLSNTNIIPSEWSDKISSVKWYVGDLERESGFIGSEVYDYENNITTSLTSKLGLIYLSDYYYAYNSGGKTDCSVTTCTNWLTDTSNGIWTMTRYGYYEYSGVYYRAWYVTSHGSVSPAYMYYTNVVRPVFYLIKDVYITNPEATGSSTDPFILSY